MGSDKRVVLRVPFLGFFCLQCTGHGWMDGWMERERGGAMVSGREAAIQDSVYI